MEEYIPSKPFRIEHEVINACNKDCGFCYSAPQFDGVLTSFKDLQYIFRKTQEQVQPFDVIFLGGEPFLRKDMIDIMQDAKSVFKGFVSVSTNGTQFYKMKKKPARSS